MFCTKCGAQNTEGAVFCASCGDRLQAAGTAHPQPQYQPPTQGYQENTYSQGYYQPQQAYAAPARANNKKGLIIGLIAGGVVLIGAVILIIVLTGGQAASGVIGKWYDEAGYAGTLDFHSGGTVDITAAGVKVPAEYTFDQKTGYGQIGVYGTTSEFTVENGVLYMEGTRYVRQYVEQFDLSDFDLSDFDFDFDFN